ncbi:MAG: CPXCG motif-containing cysteine-rich protein [Bacteroidetes bacterium]|jgi:hypothetical protein|nr:CPXCG motif-containing cysteine-rich protein [Bacteroidota bacterium]
MDTGSFVNYQCPVCGSLNEAFADPTAGPEQTFVEDCTVCCRPNVLRLRIDQRSGEVTVDVEFEG